MGWHDERFTEDAKKLRVECKVCSTPMFLPKSKAHKYLTCGPTCADARRKAIVAARERQCETCGKPFTPRTVQLAAGHGRYCSQKCNYAVNKARLHTPEAHKKAAAARSMTYSPPVGPDSWSWKGGFTKSGGYINCSSVVTKRANGGTAAAHRAAMEAHLGRKLNSSEIVHHINHDKADNRIENLRVMTRGEHLREHLPELLAARGLVRGE